jgi:hypothetical protein
MDGHEGASAMRALKELESEKVGKRDGRKCAKRSEFAVIRETVASNLPAKLAVEMIVCIGHAALSRV